jgi:hypothetical protein
MSDVFLSYASEDLGRIAALVRALGALGWSVWWDRRIPPGKTFSQVIKTELESARCVVVVWSVSSIKSEWVEIEASEAKQRKILIPALLDDVVRDIPLEFRRMQSAYLADWRGDHRDPNFTALASAVNELCPLEGFSIHEVRGDSTARKSSRQPRTSRVKKKPASAQTILSDVKAPEATIGLRTGAAHAATGIRGVNNTPLAIPDNWPAGIASAIRIIEPGTVKKLQVSVEIEHTYIGDLIVELIGPGGQRAKLHDRTGGTGRQLNHTYDSAVTTALAVFSGLNFQGDWVLSVKDVASNDVGRLKRWSLDLG